MSVFDRDNCKGRRIVARRKANKGSGNVRAKRKWYERRQGQSAGERMEGRRQGRKQFEGRA